MVIDRYGHRPLGVAGHGHDVVGGQAGFRDGLAGCLADALPPFGGVLFGGLIVALTAGYWGHFQLSRHAILVATVAGLISVWSVGMLYRLPARRTWSSIPAWANSASNAATLVIPGRTAIRMIMIDDDSEYSIQRNWFWPRLNWSR